MQGTRTHGVEVTVGSADLVRIELPRWVQDRFSHRSRVQPETPGS